MRRRGRLRATQQANASAQPSRTIHECNRALTAREPHDTNAASSRGAGSPMLSRFVALLIASTAAAPALAASQAELDSLANSMGVRVAILDNKPATCPKQPDGG